MGSFTQELMLFTYGFFKKSEVLDTNVSASTLGALDVFRSTVEVMLMDGVLTREEKRLIIKLASVLNLDPEEPAYIYESIQAGAESRSGEFISPQDMRTIYTNAITYDCTPGGLYTWRTAHPLNKAGHKCLRAFENFARARGLLCARR